MDAAWHPDPTGQAELRYFDGQQWTEHVSTGGVQSTAPLSPAQPQAQQPAQQQAQQPQHMQPQHAQQMPQGQRPQGGGLPGGISGDLIDGRYKEIDAGPGAALQNKKLLRVRMGEPFFARQGSMVAYQGQATFNFQGSGGIGKFMKKALTGEGVPLMRVEGQGDVFIAEEAREIHLLQIEGGGISVNGASVLAFSAGLEWNIERVQGAGMMAGGLFNTTLRGHGWVAIMTEGEPVVLDPSEAPTFTDMQAVVAWSLGLQTTLQKSFTAGALIGRGSGEAFQVAFHGQGFVIVQPSEAKKGVPPHSHGAGGILGG